MPQLGSSMPEIRGYIGIATGLFSGIGALLGLGALFGLI